MMERLLTNNLHLDADLIAPYEFLENWFSILQENERKNKKTAKNAIRVLKLQKTKQSPLFQQSNKYERNFLKRKEAEKLWSCSQSCYDTNFPNYQRLFQYFNIQLANESHEFNNLVPPVPAKTFFEINIHNEYTDKTILTTFHNQTNLFTEVCTIGIQSAIDLNTTALRENNILLIDHRNIELNQQPDYQTRVAHAASIEQIPSGTFESLESPSTTISISHTQTQTLEIIPYMLLIVISILSLLSLWKIFWSKTEKRTKSAGVTKRPKFASPILDLKLHNTKIFKSPERNYHLSKYKMHSIDKTVKKQEETHNEIQKPLEIWDLYAKCLHGNSPEYLSNPLFLQSPQKQSIQALATKVFQSPKKLEKVSLIVPLSSPSKASPPKRKIILDEEHVRQICVVAAPHEIERVVPYEESDPVPVVEDQDNKNPSNQKESPLLEFPQIYEQNREEDALIPLSIEFNESFRKEWELDNDEDASTIGTEEEDEDELEVVTTDKPLEIGESVDVVEEIEQVELSEDSHPRIIELVHCSSPSSRENESPIEEISQVPSPAIDSENDITENNLVEAEKTESCESIISEKTNSPIIPSGKALFVSRLEEETLNNCHDLEVDSVDSSEPKRDLMKDFFEDQQQVIDHTPPLLSKELESAVVIEELVTEPKDVSHPQPFLSDFELTEKDSSPEVYSTKFDPKKWRESRLHQPLQRSKVPYDQSIQESFELAATTLSSGSFDTTSLSRNEDSNYFNLSATPKDILLNSEIPKTMNPYCFYDENPFQQISSTEPSSQSILPLPSTDVADDLSAIEVTRDDISHFADSSTCSSTSRFPTDLSSISSFPSLSSLSQQSNYCNSSSSSTISEQNKTLKELKENSLKNIVNSPSYQSRNTPLRVKSFANGESHPIEKLYSPSQGNKPLISTENTMIRRYKTKQDISFPEKYNICFPRHYQVYNPSSSADKNSSRSRGNHEKNKKELQYPQNIHLFRQEKDSAERLHSPQRALRNSWSEEQQQAHNPLLPLNRNNNDSSPKPVPHSPRVDHILRTPGSVGNRSKKSTAIPLVTQSVDRFFKTMKETKKKDNNRVDERSSPSNYPLLDSYENITIQELLDKRKGFNPDYYQELIKSTASPNQSSSANQDRVDLVDATEKENRHLNNSPTVKLVPFPSSVLMEDNPLRSPKFRSPAEFPKGSLLSVKQDDQEISVHSKVSLDSASKSSSSSSLSAQSIGKSSDVSSYQFPLQEEDTRPQLTPVGQHSGESIQYTPLWNTMKKRNRLSEQAFEQQLMGGFDEESAPSGLVLEYDDDNQTVDYEAIHLRQKINYMRKHQFQDY